MTQGRDVELVLSFGTVRRAGFADRVEAAANAGFTAIGLTITEYRSLHQMGWSDEDIRRILERYGVALGEAELLVGFWAEPGPANVPARPGMVYADPENEALAFRMADEFGLPVVQAVGTFDDREIGPEVVDAFGALCDRAAPHGLGIALEFVPYTSIPNLAVAREIAAAAGRANGGLCVDTWHFFRGGSDLSELDSLTQSDVLMIQVNDGSLVRPGADVMTEAVTTRRCPGEGEFGVDEFLRRLWRAGVDRPLSVEVYSSELERTASREGAQRAAGATRAVAQHAEEG